MTREAITGALALADEVLRWNRLKDLRGCDISPEDRRVLDVQFAGGFSADADYAPALALALKQAEKHIEALISAAANSHDYEPQDRRCYSCSHIAGAIFDARAFLASLKEQSQ